MFRTAYYSNEPSILQYHYLFKNPVSSRSDIYAYNHYIPSRLSQAQKGLELGPRLGLKHAQGQYLMHVMLNKINTIGFWTKKIKR